MKAVFEEAGVELPESFIESEELEVDEANETDVDEKTKKIELIVGTLLPFLNSIKQGEKNG